MLSIPGRRHVLQCDTVRVVPGGGAVSLGVHCATQISYDPLMWPGHSGRVQCDAAPTFLRMCTMHIGRHTQCVESKDRRRIVVCCFPLPRAPLTVLER